MCIWQVGVYPFKERLFVGCHKEVREHCMSVLFYPRAIVDSCSSPNTASDGSICFWGFDWKIDLT